MAELTKVLELDNYIGELYVIKPYIENGKIKRSKVFKCLKNHTRDENESQRHSTYHYLGNIKGLNFYQSIYYINQIGVAITNETKIIADGARYFTEKKEAENALNEFASGVYYKLMNSIQQRMTVLEVKRKKINSELKELKEKKEECFKHLTTTFSKK